MQGCPYCDQGALWHVEISGVDVALVMCNECDTIWMKGERVEYGTGTIFENFMSSRNLPPDWKAVRLLEIVE